MVPGIDVYLGHLLRKEIAKAPAFYLLMLTVWIGGSIPSWYLLTMILP